MSGGIRSTRKTQSMTSIVLRALVLALLVFATSLAHAAPPTLTGKHGQIGLSCASCHGAETPSARAPASACGQCHGSYDKLAEATAGVDPNPHKSHQGEVRCTLCHKSHRPSVLFCNECHTFELKVK